jgi:hypothetical protein
MLPEQSTLDMATPARTLRFEPVPHRYFLEPDGIELPSVTTVLKETRMIDYSMIPQDLLEAAAKRGTTVHELLRLLDDGDLDWEVTDEEFKGYFTAYQQFCKDSRFTPHLVEHRVWHPQWLYAGTLDRTGTMGADLVCLDFKTGLVLPGHALQLAAYTMCLPDPRRYRRIGLQLSGDGSYRAHEWPGRDLRQDFDLFLAALACRRWQMAQGNRR